MLIVVSTIKYCRVKRENSFIHYPMTRGCRVVDCCVMEGIHFRHCRSSMSWDPQKHHFQCHSLGSYSRCPKLQEIVALPKSIDTGCIFCPSVSNSIQFRWISIFLVHEPIKILLSNVEGLNHLPLPPNYRILLSNHTQPMPTTLLSTGGSIVVITKHFVVCHIGTIQPQPSMAVCDLDEADSIRNCCVLLHQY